jgi:RNase P subunit RPR2
MLTGGRLIGRGVDAMPDEHGRLTEADNDLIERWWSQHSKDAVICLFCKTTDWRIAGHLVNIQCDAVDANASNAPSYPHIVVTCKSCAHSMFFNAVQIGIAAYVPTARQPTVGAAASDAMKQGGILELSQRLSDLIKKQV